MRCNPILMLCSAFAAPLSCAAQQVEPFVFGEVRTIASTVLGMERTVNVHLPAGYSSDSLVRYPVIYVLDGSAEEDFPHVTGLVQFMNMYDLLPTSIVVGIANVDRSHDFTHPTHGDSDLVWVPTGGGSAAFIEFIALELLPFIDGTYRTDTSRTIIGQSLGGLLGAEVLFKRPELFDNYILVSPSLWWDKGSLAAGADQWTRKHGALPVHVFLAIARDDDWMRTEIEQVAAAFSAHSRPPFRWTLMPFPGESHMTILHRAVYRGFEWLSEKQ